MRTPIRARDARIAVAVVALAFAVAGPVMAEDSVDPPTASAGPAPAAAAGASVAQPTDKAGPAPAAAPGASVDQPTSSH